MTQPSRFWARSIPPNLGEDLDTDWTVYGLYRGPADSLDDLGVFVSVLGEGSMPHMPHVHHSEEILVVLSGNLRVETDSHSEVIGPGELFYVPADERHAITGAGPGPTVMYVLKWEGVERHPDAPRSEVVFWRNAEGQLRENSSGRGMEVVTGLDTRTRHLDRLCCRYAEIAPGSGHPTHRHDNAVMLLMLRGEITGLFHRNVSPAVIYAGGNIPHAQLNEGTEPAAFYAVEFH